MLRGDNGMFTAQIISFTFKKDDFDSQGEMCLEHNGKHKNKNKKVRSGLKRVL